VLNAIEAHSITIGVSIFILQFKKIIICGINKFPFLYLNTLTNKSNKKKKKNK
ncbi:uncharacterized protein METZ01_LOCUS393670, partial [marine metagenome]